MYAVQYEGRLIPLDSGLGECVMCMNVGKDL